MITRIPALRVRIPYIGLPSCILLLLLNATDMAAQPSFTTVRFQSTSTEIQTQARKLIPANIDLGIMYELGSGFLVRSEFSWQDLRFATALTVGSFGRVLSFRGFLALRHPIRLFTKFGSILTYVEPSIEWTLIYHPIARGSFLQSISTVLTPGLALAVDVPVSKTIRMGGSAGLGLMPLVGVVVILRAQIMFSI